MSSSSNEHAGDVYFKYAFQTTPNIGEIYKIDHFNFNEQKCKFDTDNKYMSASLDYLYVYACKHDNCFKPWLLQLYGHNYSGSEYLNYFFKLQDDGENWKNESFISLNVPSGSSDGSIERKEDEEAKRHLDGKYKSVLSNSTAAYYYYYTPSASSLGSQILPNKLPEYLSESDKSHSTGDWTQSKFYSVTEGSVENPILEITFKGRRSASPRSSNNIVTYYSQSHSFFLNQKSSSTKQIVSGSVSSSSCQAKGTEKAKQTESAEPGGSEGGSESVQQPSKQSTQGSSPSSGETGKSTSSTGTEHSSSPSTYSSNLPWIVGGAVIGSGGLIGTGAFIYKCIR
ncbi:hypothetical protein BdWA1_001011 [Babesia duncani]|uniref:Uncharacterized protein n=1 Tax=Babesia duncani TaxID=323732 RepID=A0AAD9PNV0_9APIC|nr:hypothetical protein BdWA1_001011 [Babesia duncani]